MILQPGELEILRELGDCHRHNAYELAEELDMPTYVVRGTLKLFRREQLATDHGAPGQFTITNRGLERVLEAEQLELPKIP